HGPALGVAGVGPGGHCRLERAAKLGLARAVRAPGVDGAAQAEQRQVAEQVLAVLLRRPDDSPAILGEGRLARELLGVGEERAPLREQQIDDVEVLALALAAAARG